MSEYDDVVDVCTFGSWDAEVQLKSGHISLQVA